MLASRRVNLEGVGDRCDALCSVGAAQIIIIVVVEATELVVAKIQLHTQTQINNAYRTLGIDV